MPGLIRLSAGFMYLLIYQIGSGYISDDLIQSKDFADFRLVTQYFLLGLWGRIALYKYIACWLVTEGACIVIGKQSQTHFTSLFLNL